ncbi:AAA family ATPase [Prevotella sp. PINT]|jgi:ATP-dependent exoDNAse (exonuclease V), alpha subunit - helicase superfamily I member|uniref:ATP-dependent DNA helicase n=1 Tax=Palleniella intestinalis TaxID=2736291 RepID=UPI001556B6FB|nr:AAA family ATPase [Palleniella intestinalis]NPD80916.1 AAA family ATPase [Palleniella intestinalis]
MIEQEWAYQIESCLPFSPTAGQGMAVAVFSRFMTDASPDVAMLLRGSAGTGKTSVARAIVRAMTAMKQKVVLLAPTGRAAKVFEQGIAGGATHAYTIHRKIYRQRAYMSDAFTLADNMHTDTIFMVDEASMVSTSELGVSGAFGAGNLLDDLVRYVYSGRNCRLVLIGDTAQLPPVGCEEAPALVSGYIAGYGLTVYDYDLTEVLRQSQESGILWNATMLRNLITHDDMTQLPKIRFDGFADITICPGNELIDSLGSSYSRVGMDETIVITRSNKRANVYNLGIRNQVLDREEELSSGDSVMIVKNNYFWTETIKAEMGKEEKEDDNLPPFLANGDRCVVRRVRNSRELFGFRFADVLLEFPDYNGLEIQATTLLDTLQSEAPALTYEQQETLFNGVLEDYADMSRKQDKFKALKEDKHFNALQIKYAYAVTCHKAQGGQWAHVYVDQGYMTDDMLSPSYIHWLYTAFTRATEHLYLVNWREEQTERNQQVVDEN